MVKTTRASYNRPTGDIMTTVSEDIPAVERVLIDGIEQGVIAVLQIFDRTRAERHDHRGVEARVQRVTCLRPQFGGH